MERRHSTRHTTRRSTTSVRRAGAVLGATALVFALGACDDDDDVIDDAGDDIDELGDDIEQGLEDAGGAVVDVIDEIGEDSAELAARNLASTHGADEFSDAGYPLDGDLTCEADATDDLTAIEIDCAGATEDGDVVSMTGTTTELPGASLTELEGDFVGFVDTEEVFRSVAIG